MDFGQSVSWKLDLSSGLSVISIRGAVSQMRHMEPCSCIWDIFIRERSHPWAFDSLRPKMGKRNIVCAVQRKEQERICSLSFFRGFSFCLSQVWSCWRPHYYIQKNNTFTLSAKDEISVNLSSCKWVIGQGHSLCIVVDTPFHVARKRMYSHIIRWQFRSLSIKNFLIHSAELTGLGWWSQVHRLDPRLNIEYLVPGDITTMKRISQIAKFIALLSCPQVTWNLYVLATTTTWNIMFGWTFD